MVGRLALRMPVPVQIRLLNFSLYEERPVVDVHFGGGVFCLAGANGLGKSTFLATLGYAITGIVANPAQRFQSMTEYYKDSLEFSKDYFDGRIDQYNRDVAEVELSFSVGERSYDIRRGMFEPDALRSLKVSESDGAIVVNEEAELGAASRELHEKYVLQIVADSQAANFEELVFLHHFLLTFDERRELLFWNSDLARPALYLAFGLDRDRASQADEWLRKADRLESQARNAQYQATTARQQAKDLLARANEGGQVAPDLLDTHERLVQELEELRSTVSVKARAVDDLRLRSAAAASAHHSLLNDFNSAFSSELGARRSPLLHPLVSMLLAENHCQVCGSSGAHLGEHVIASVDSGKCPLCLSELVVAQTKRGDSDDPLLALDERIKFAALELSNAKAALERAVNDLNVSREDEAEALERLAAFEQEHSEVISTGRDGPASLTPILDQLERERVNALERRDAFRARRDEYRLKLSPIQDEFSERYLEAESAFVPRFQRLAQEFLGIDLQISMEQRTRGPELVLTINGTRRRRTTQLSESQRYFVDIALRMALAEHMCGPSNTVTIYIDTPEGSLDIAYEDRAGRMFGTFAKNGNRLILTANINSSRLLQRLADVCRSSHMRIERMTSWSVLSEVQAESETLFDRAYDEIESALQNGLAE